MKKVEPARLLEELVAIPSTSGQEAAVASRIVEWAGERGLAVETWGRNVVLVKGRGPGRLLLNSHLDTVPPAAGWRTDPFRPTRQGSRIVGLGANDAKGCVACMLCALDLLEDGELGGEVVLALTVEEETGCGDGLESLVPELGRLDAAVIGEPTGLDVCRAQKGLLVVEVETRGTARHAAHAHAIPGPNAVVEAAGAIDALEGISFGEPHPLLGPVTCQVTTIRGGERHNVIPQRCVFDLDIRTVNGIATAEIVSRIVERTGARVHVRSERLRPFETDEGDPLVRAALAARPGARVVGSSTMSDGVWTRHLPTIKAGPGLSERSHAAGEFVTVEELEQGVAFYAGLVREYLPQEDRG